MRPLFEANSDFSLTKPVGDLDLPLIWTNKGWSRGGHIKRCALYYVKPLSKYTKFDRLARQRPHHVESTSFRPITEVKQRWAQLVLGWVTAWEHRVLLAKYFLLLYYIQ